MENGQGIITAFSTAEPFRWVGLVWLVPLFPAAATLLNGLLGRKVIRYRTGQLATVAMLGALIVSLLCIWDIARTGQPYNVDYFIWIGVGDFQLPFGFYVDQLTAVMLFVVSFVGTVIFLYAIGYMHGHPGYWRFFTYMPLFAVMMFLLVLGNSLPVLFVGWEGVGLCSYLLIGYFFDRDYAAQAGRKAFIVNRIGDFGFLLGMLLLYWTLGSVRFTDIVEHAPDIYPAGSVMITVITLLLFLGATGKSAQIPLFVWLPDAMAGPTPVSALIHAATMVTAGVYMIARLNLLYSLAPISLLVVGTVGALTALMAATIAFTQREAKRILAYSTISQLGYMFLALGVGAFDAGIFHLMTHAFFKACLFLSAGSVLHAFHEDRDVDIFQAGGLRRYMPMTRLAFLVSAVAIAGIPPFAGFFSKDEILFEAFAGGYILFWGIGLTAAFCTAFYMFRLYSLLFSGEFRGTEHQRRHLHECPFIMWFPLVILALLSLVGGWVNIPGLFPKFHAFLRPVFAEAHELAGPHRELAGARIWEISLALLSVLVALTGIFAARLCYVQLPKLPHWFAETFPSLFIASLHKYWIDEAYQATVVKGFYSACRLAQWCDNRIIVAGLNAFAALIRHLSEIGTQLQTGYVRHYALAIVIGVVFLLIGMLL
ncbi:MAG TPA: NADH-quinone oxidoreductase subunit L [bacterium]|nr:NADH-quinone oxidoreductase subunit L [bacterium]HQL61365.1 NADH-quinone oxidoreductase subunit L [bacterium]